MSGAKLSGVTLSVRDLNAQSRWYRERFGLEQLAALDLESYRLCGVVLSSPAGWTLELLQREGSGGGIREGHPLDAARTLGYGSVTIEVDDLVADFDSLVEHGATELMGPHPGPSGFGAFVSDPEGNIIRLASRPGVIPDIPLPPGPPPGGPARPGELPPVDSGTLATSTGGAP
ncbi:hypothetical protein GCM10027416_04250 [Okibacterium endophyticum]